MARKKRPQREDLDTIWDLDIERISKAAKGDAISEAIGHNLSSLAIEKHPETLRTYGEMTQDELLLVISILKAQVERQARNFFETDEELRKLVHALPAIQRLKRLAQDSATGTVGGKASGEARQETAKCTPEVAQTAAKKLLAAGKEKREIAGILAKRFVVTPDWIRRLLKKKSTTEPSTDR